MRDAVRGFGIASDRIVIQPRGVPLDRFIPRQDGATNETFTLICSRRFTKIFHHDTLIEACRMLASTSLPFQLDLCSEGPEFVRIQHLVSKWGLTERVRFFSRVEHNRMAQLLSSAHVFVSLSEVDGASAGLFEAMSVGAYPVVSDIDANRIWIRDGVNGRLVRFDDAAGLARIIQTLYTKRDTLYEAAQVNRQMVERSLNLAENTRVFAQLFRQIVSPPTLCARSRSLSGNNSQTD
jgi:glycosyltransferase involved in cell wall biosynthesis